jgi:hypothetical protein
MLPCQRQARCAGYCHRLLPFQSLSGPFGDTAIFNAHGRRQCQRVTKAEDLVQETYLRAWRSYEGF